MPTERFQFTGSEGQQLAAALDTPDGEVRAYALFAHCFTCGKDGLAAKRIAVALSAKGIAVLRFDFTVGANRAALWRAWARYRGDLGPRNRFWRRFGQLFHAQRAGDARLRLPPGANLSRRTHRCAHACPARSFAPITAGRLGGRDRPDPIHAVGLSEIRGQRPRRRRRRSSFPVLPTRWRRPRISCARRAGARARAGMKASRTSTLLLQWNSSPVYAKTLGSVRGQACGEVKAGAPVSSLVSGLNTF